VGMEQGPLSLVMISEELLEWKSSGSGSRKPRLTAMGIRCTDHATPTRKVGNTLSTSGGHSVGIVCLRTKAMNIYIYIYGLSGFKSKSLMGVTIIVHLPHLESKSSMRGV
jgi:hypothetical protein